MNDMKNLQVEITLDLIKGLSHPNRKSKWCNIIVEITLDLIKGLSQSISVCRWANISSSGNYIRPD